jgi:hypothetical protein
MTGTSEREQLSQLKACLFQWAEQLNLTLNSLDSGVTSSVERYVSKNALLREESKGKVDATATFNAIKGLIIKSADIVEAYYQEIDRQLQGIYVAQSDFGTYMEETEFTIEETPTSIKNIFNSVKIVTDEASENTLFRRSTEGHIKTGKLGEDQNGYDIIGIEIGQTNLDDNNKEVFNKFARFTADMLSFYDPKGSTTEPVAYISGNKLYIPNAEITVSLQIGGYVDFVTAGGGVITKWVGRS